MLAEQRQHHQQVDRRQDGVDQRDLDLSEDELRERHLQRGRAGDQCAGQRTAIGARDSPVQRHHRADDEADQDMEQRAQDVRAEALGHLRMFAQGGNQRGREFIDAAWQVVAEPARQLVARAVEDVGGVIHQPFERIAIAADKAHERPDAAAQGEEDDGGEDQHRQRVPPGMAREARGEHFDQ
ncbi:hypothetical protein D3C87_1280970 [compost metagenome]